MLTDAALAQLCAATYIDAPSLPVPATGTDARVITADGTAVVAFRGSVTAEDWARDFVCAPITDREDPQLGRCHAGFLDGAESILAEVTAAIGARRAIITGHSLGGALALGVGALLTCAKRPPLAIVTFGAPRFGMAKFVATLAALPVRQYRRGNDPVPLVPAYLPPLLEFLDARDPLIAVGAAQQDMFKAHAITGYVTDVTAYLTPAKAPIPTLAKT